MSIFTDVKDLSGGKKQSKEWYREQLFYGLQDYTGSFDVGDIILFSYAAATEKLPFYDRFPMVLITDKDTQNMQFSGGNAHYLRPDARKAICNNWSRGSIAFPERCYHKYFMSNVSGVKTIKREDLNNMTPLPIEQFTMSRVGRMIDVPSSFIWSRL
jgi:hypothetical protein